MKKAINFLSLLIGVSIHKKKRLKKVVFKKSDRPLLIEFMGVSGVGKSYLFNELNQPYLDIDHFEFINAYNSQTNILEKIKEPTIYEILAKYKIDNIQKDIEISNCDKLQVLGRSFRKLKQDAAFFLYDTNRVLLSEEGVLQFFTQEIEQCIDDGMSDQLNLLYKNRAVIYCHAPAATIVDRVYKRRQETGKLWYKHKQKTKEELCVEIEKQIQDKENLLRKIKKQIPVLTINSAHDVKNNKEKILNFIISLEKDGTK